MRKFRVHSLRFVFIATAMLLFACSNEDANVSQAPDSSSKSASVAQMEAVLVDQGWARPTLVSGQAGAAFFQITNNSGQDDRLIAVSTPRAARAEMHDNVAEAMVMRMVHLAEVSVPAGATVQFVPGGKHTMLFDLKAPLVAGDLFPMTLTFAGAGDIKIIVTVSDSMQAPAMPGYYED